MLRESLLAAEITAVTGIVNGTTNFILTEMARGGLPYGDALARAQELGYAEADPTEDVDGADAAAKMAILSCIAFHTRVHDRRRAVRGHRPAGGRGPGHAASLGFVVKLLGVARLLNGVGERARVPALVPRGHRLAAIGGPDNAVLLESRTTREIMLVGPGAGGAETASAVVADLLSILGTHQGSFLHNALADSGRTIARARGRWSRPSTCACPWPTARACSRAWRRSSATQAVSIRTVVQSGSGDEASLVLVLHSRARGAGGGGRGGPARAGRRARGAGAAARARKRGGGSVIPLIERYREFLPVTDATPVVSLGEGPPPWCRCRGCPSAWAWRCTPRWRA